MSVVHPHRKSVFSHFQIPQIFVEGSYKKFGIRPDKGDSNFLACVLFTILFGCLSMSLSSLLIIGFGVFVSDAFSLMSVALLLTIIVEILAPVPYKVAKGVIKEVISTEVRDNLNPSEKWWIYTHYFIFRNHPLLNKWMVFLRVFCVSVFPVVYTIWKPHVLSGGFMTAALLMYLSYKLSYLEGE